MISLTGDIATGRKVLAAAAKSVKRTHLELGGKAPVIVFDDADIDAVVQGVRTFGTDIRDQSLGERDDYTSLVWLAGTTAYYELTRQKDAMAMFQRNHEPARSPQTISKGSYWAGPPTQNTGA